MLFAYSAKDAYLVLLSTLELALILYAGIYFQALPGGALLLLAALGIFLNCTNFQCIAHNFIHIPFFKSPLLNFGFSVLNTLPLGLPQRWNPRFFLMFYLPVWYLGQVAAAAENYLEHYGAATGDRRAYSMSCYGRVYNFIWFNNGYHQEHHCRPGVHWTQLKAVRKEILSAAQRRVVALAHWFNPSPEQR